MIPQVEEFHGYLTEMGRSATFGAAVSADELRGRGSGRKISEKAPRGPRKNEKIGPRRRWWIEEHAKYDDEHPIHALEFIKGCVKRGEAAAGLTESALKSLALMKEAMVASLRLMTNGQAALRPPRDATPPTVAQRDTQTAGVRPVRVGARSWLPRRRVW